MKPPLQVTKRTLFSWVFHRHLKLQILLVVIILITVASRVLPLELQKNIINDAIGMRDVDLLLFYSGLYIAIVVLGGILKYAINLIQSYIGQQTLKTIRRDLFNHIISLPLPFFRKTPPGTVINSMVTELNPVGDFIGQAFSTPLVNILTFLAIAGFMFYLNPLLAGLSLLLYPTELIILPWLQRKMNAANRRRMASTQSVSGTIGESIGGVQEIHANASYKLEDDKFGKKLDLLYKNTLTMYAFKYGIKFYNNFFQSLGPFILFLVGGYLAIQGQLDIGALVAFLSSYEKLYDPWKELMEYYQTYQDSTVRYSQIMSYYDIEPEYLFSPVDRSLHEMHGQIDAQAVGYMVDGNIKLLDRINLSVQPGELLALVGFSGSGKSTLALCMAQIFNYTSGSLKIDGRELNRLTKADMAVNMGMVAQHPFIFEGTLQDNLLYSCEAQRLQGKTCPGMSGTPSLDRIIEVIQQVGLYLDVLSFGFRGTLDPEKDQELAGHILHARQMLRQNAGEDLVEDVEFFDPQHYVHGATLAQNLIFGSSATPGLTSETLHANASFRRFLKTQELLEPLDALGHAIASRNVDVINTLGGGMELFADSPIPADDFDEYALLVSRVPEYDFAKFDENDRAKLLKLALGFISSSNAMGRISSDLRRRIVSSRAAFKKWAEENAPGAFTFYRLDSYIASESILDNILFGVIRPEIAGAEDRIKKRIMQVLIIEDVLDRIIEYGLQFNVGSQGDRLSGGQRQKTALARVFLKNPPILILDEATAALDNASQTRIQNLLESKFKTKSTVIAVVHRLDILKGYDRIGVLKSGKLVELGSYEELIKKKGVFHELVHGRQ
ncbi:ABC-type multidrug transport system, ATPase and permease component [Desulfonatronum thiosulfatophilum]|uniref:ABC-type multidrug transport system, ATPase and permease component n=1 Tax=Desulfonatronum thiosulfatophilum TaxID=617002 RepID=A0A1G6AJ37_9BACT|nr:ABC transporter ATP-binding protein/permease [Desulfonatronum thiosulfatophilum]SDB08422.1 ABC-type multidrug transport system, ATPase and permease component [Desulfonatronum thiosulfatophilum]